MSKENKSEWKPVEDKIFKFEKIGDFVEGVLLSVEDGAVYNNKVYKIKQTDGTILSIFSTTVLESMMGSIPIGNEVKIVHSGIKKTTIKGREDTKLYEVYTK